MLDILNNDTWEQAFAVGELDVREAGIGTGVTLGEVLREDVQSVLSSDIKDGDYSETDVLCVGQPIDGRWFLLSASCDTTGWDCQSWGHVIVAKNKRTLLRFGLSAAERQRLKL